MRSLFILYILIISNSIFAQNYVISEFEECGSSLRYPKLFEHFQNQDKDITILRLNSRHYLTFKDNLIYKYNVAESENLILEKEKLSKDETYYYKKLLDTLRTINPSLLNITENEKGEKIVVEDGETFQIELFKENCKVNYSSYSPNVYIENKYPSFKERKKFVDVFNSMKALFYDIEYENLKRIDTIYLIYEKLNETRNLKIEKTLANNISIYSFLFSDNKNLILKTLSQEREVVKKKAINNKVKIDLSTINKYRFSAMFEILSNKKAIYIIDKEENFKKNKIVLMKAYLDYNP